jgi:DNA-binding NtrC family response regulator
MGKSPKILIADRNRHVRDFLRREFMAAGYLVEVAKDGHEVLHLIDAGWGPDLIILDPEAPYLVELAVLLRLRERYPHLPIVIHSLGPDSVQAEDQATFFVEKKGETERLKVVVDRAIHSPNCSVSL